MLIEPQERRQGAIPDRTSSTTSKSNAPYWILYLRLLALTELSFKDLRSTVCLWLHHTTHHSTEGHHFHLDHHQVSSLHLREHQGQRGEEVMLWV